jgi:hypothetical protein
MIVMGRWDYIFGHRPTGDVPGIPDGQSAPASGYRFYSKYCNYFRASLPLSNLGLYALLKGTSMAAGNRIHNFRFLRVKVNLKENSGLSPRIPSTWLHIEINELEKTK